MRTLRAAADAARYARTVRYLKAGQIYHRLRLTLKRHVVEQMSTSVDAWYRRSARALAPACFASPAIHGLAIRWAARRSKEEWIRIAEDAMVGRFTFLSRTETFGATVAWHSPDLDRGTRLWKTLLHEFSYGIALAVAYRSTENRAYRSRFFELVESWREANPIGIPGYARDAWNTRAVATRLMHWTVSAHLFNLTPAEAQHLGHEAAVHALFLRDNLELDLGGNHLVRDLVGLVLARTLFGGFDQGLALLERELREQVLPDGCHVERVPMYHAIVLRDLVDVRLLLADGAPQWLDDAITRMAMFLRDLCHGDGELPLFGDSWLGEVVPRQLVEDVDDLHLLGPSSTSVEGSGLKVVETGAAHLVARVGPHGPDHQLGHAHADLLSFELSFGQTRLITDTGTGTYDEGPVRLRARSTAAHNTVQVDSAEQLEAWSSFRVGRRGRAREMGAGSIARMGVHASWLWSRHGAYAKLGVPAVQRMWLLGDTFLVVFDLVEGRGRHRVESRLHVHPDAGDELHIVGLGAKATEHVVPFYPRFNVERSMRELTVADEVDRLPWLGGWLVVFGAPAHDPGVVTWCPDASGPRMRYEAVDLAFEARWHCWREPAFDSVQLRIAPFAPIRT